MVQTAAAPATAPEGRALTLLRTPAELRLASSCVGSLIAGLLVGGLGPRLVMRLSAMAADDSRIGLLTENGNVVGAITTEGTLALLLFVGLPAGLSMGLFLFLLRSVLPARFLPLWVSLVLLAFASPLVIDPGNADFTIVGNGALNVAMFVALFPAFGFCSIWIAERFERWLVQPPLARLAPLTIAGSVLGACFGVLGLLVLMVASGPLATALLVVFSAAAIVAIAPNAGTSLLARGIALCVAAVGTIAGLIGLIGDARTIVG
jgi:hypothetical protein